MTKSATAAKAPNVTAIATAALARVANAAMAQGKSRAEVASLVKQSIGAKGKAQAARQNDTRREYMAGRMAYSLSITIDAARKLLGYANADGKGALKKGQGRRNKEQEKAYNAAKVYWSDILRAAGIVSTSAKAGNSNAKSKDKAKRAPHHNDVGVTIEPAFAKPKTPSPASLPKAKTREDVENHVLQAALTLAAFIDKNASVASPQCSSIVQDFVTSAKAALAPARGNKG